VGSAADHVSHEYPRSVVDGRVVAGKWVRLACERHLDDLRHGGERGLWFDPAAANLALGFFSLLRFSKGRWGGKPFVTAPWQTWAIGSMFGWRREDGSRRYRETHLEVARKNGKTETAAGVGLKLLAADREPGAEVYCLATKRDQARLTFDVAKAMVSRSDPLRRNIRRMKAELQCDGSKMVPLGADADSLDGLNVHGAIKDELHAWKSRDLWDVIDTATGARDQYMGLSTTTAGYNRRSIWWERRELCLKVLEGADGYDDDGLFPLIYTPDDADDWEDEACWIKGNPNLGVTVRVEEIRERAAEAKRTPGQVNAFRRLRLNQPTETATRWLPMDRWRQCGRGPIPEEALVGRECYGGLDLSQTTDLTAFALVFPPSAEDPKYRLLVRHFLPREDIDGREGRDRVPYRRWADGRRLTLSEGDWIDYDLVQRRIEEDAQKFRLVSVAYDARFAPAIVQRLLAVGIDCKPQSQGYGGLTTGTKALHGYTLSRQLGHEGCPLLEWQAENAAIETDAAGSGCRPTKAKSTQRIDGIAAAVNALEICERMRSPGDAGVIELDIDTGFPSPF
jgi:phage terminase large subunit-like protein